MYFLQPGDSNMAGIEAVNDTAALKQLVEYYDTKSLVVEAAMAESAKKFNIPVRAFDDYAAHALGLLALECLPSSPVREVEREWLVFAMLQSAYRLEAQAIKVKFDGTKRFRLDFSGTVTFSAFATLTIEAGRPKIVVLYNNEADFDHGVSKSLFESEDPAGRDCLGVCFRMDNEPVLNALERAHGLLSIPEPVFFTAGMAIQPRDIEVLILAVALDATSQLVEERQDIEAYIAVEDLALGAKLKLR